MSFGSDLPAVSSFPSCPSEQEGPGVIAPATRRPLSVHCDDGRRDSSFLTGRTLSPSLLLGTHRTRRLAILPPPGEACRHPWSAEAQRNPHLPCLTFTGLAPSAPRASPRSNPSSTTSRPRPAARGCRRNNIAVDRSCYAPLRHCPS